MADVSKEKDIWMHSFRTPPDSSMNSSTTNAKQFLYAYSSVAFLTPTFRDVNKKFNKRYYLNLVLIDKENPRYFKQQEITIFRILEN
ncbi:hypothetical protein H2248_003541 [Termitomyces sp. 'cryptogamus']|nr:hypothetical protein H2248_003541 [Termitomyces sp. 'cryptogamus']